MRVIVLLLSLGWLTAGLAQPSMFIDVPQARDFTLGAKPGKKGVRWNSEIFRLPKKHHLRVTTDTGKTLVLVHEKTITHASGNKTWVGNVQGVGKKGRVVITVANDVPVGTINTPAGTIQLKDQGTYAVMVDSAEEPGTPAGFDDDMRLPPVAERMAEPAMERSLSMRNFGSTVVDVMVFYDEEMAALPGSIDAKIDNLVALSNVAYVDSGIDMELRLVHKEQVSYANTLSNSTALDDFTLNSSVFSGLETLRTDVGADLAVLLRAFDASAHGGCGIAWVGGAQGTSINARYGYAVVGYGTDPVNPLPGQSYYYCSDYSFAHELGHNMGSTHDRANSSFAGHYDYSYGYGIDGTFGTIMSYLNPEVGIFSTPELMCPPGDEPCGVDETLSDSAHNVLSINSTRGTIATFRDAVIPGPIARNKTLFYFNVIQSAL